MTEPVHAKPHYHLRLLERHVVYVESGSNLFRDWPAGAIISDPDVIEFLESRDAPVERIEPESSNEGRN
jgi:hypothetical protein